MLHKNETFTYYLQNLALEISPVATTYIAQEASVLELDVEKDRHGL